MNKFYYLDAEDKVIDDKKYICIYVLENTKHIIFSIYKLYSDELYDKVYDLDTFQEVTDIAYFVIKRNGKVSIDINL